MNISIPIGMSLSWMAVLVYWVISGFKVKKVKSQESLSVRIAQYWLPLLVASVLLGSENWFEHTFSVKGFIPHSNLVGIIGLLLCVLGAMVACRSRYLLGKNWSLSVQAKESHELIQSGIYSLVRHPIYSGILLLYAGSAIVNGGYTGVLAVVIVFISFWSKLKKEESMLTSIFGDQYLEYKTRTKALIPFVL